MLAGREWIEYELIFPVRCACWIGKHEILPPEEALLAIAAWVLWVAGVFPSPALSKLGICGMLTIFLAKDGQDSVPQGKAHSLGTSDSLISHTEVLISKQTACHCTVGQCFFWLLWSKWNGQAVVRLASEWAKGSWEIRVRLWIQVTANG